MEIKTYQRLEVLPFLPLMNQWVTDHFKQKPWSYAPPIDQLIGPADTIYVNEKQSALILGVNGEKVEAMATAVSLDSYFLNHHYFPCNVAELFERNGFKIKEILYIGCFLSKPHVRRDREAILEIYRRILDFARHLGKNEIAYMDLLSEEREKNVEPWFDLIGGFKSAGIVIDDPWPTLLNDGRIEMRTHQLAFFINRVARL